MIFEMVYGHAQESETAWVAAMRGVPHRGPLYKEIQGVSSVLAAQAPCSLGHRALVFGKPFLEAEVGRSRIQFNLSHLEGLALFAVTCGREIGIDLEHISPIPEADQISNRFFSERENAMLRSLSARLKEEAFFTLWARKEAFIKASGEGLSLHLDQFDASLALNESATLLGAEDNSERASRWSLCQLAPAPGYVSALVVAGCDWRLRCWQFPEQTL
jgi:4'-phosphopantetheinyl transferase